MNYGSPNVYGFCLTFSNLKEIHGICRNFQVNFRKCGQWCGGCESSENTDYRWKKINSEKCSILQFPKMYSAFLAVLNYPSGCLFRKSPFLVCNRDFTSYHIQKILCELNFLLYLSTFPLRLKRYFFNRGFTSHRPQRFYVNPISGHVWARVLFFNRFFTSHRTQTCHKNSIVCHT